MRAQAPPARTMPRVMLPALLIVAAGVVTYWNSLHHPFIWDDQTAIVTNPTIQHLWPLSGPLTPPRETPAAGRPIVNLSFALNYAFGGLTETGYHVVNLAIHIACALLLFGIVRRTPGSPGPGARAGPAPFFAAVVALLWMVHPLQSEVVNYVTQRSESLMALFLFLTLYGAIRAAESPAWRALSVIACACGMASKESMVVAPIVVVLYDRAFLFDSVSDAIRKRTHLYAGLAATWVVLAALAWNTPRSTVGVTAAVGSWTYLLNQAQMIGRYLRLSVWPDALVLDYGLPGPVAVRDVLPSALLVIALLAATGVALVRWPRIGFLAAVFFLTLAPTSSVIPIVSEVGAERRMYVPLAALATLAVAGARFVLNLTAPTSFIAVVSLTGFVLAGLAARTVARNAEYSTPLTLWRTVVDRFPQGRARMALANELVTAGQHTQAIALLRQAAPDFPDARAALGTELLFQGQREEGVAVLRQFIEDDPSRVNRIPAYVLLAETMASQGNVEGAIAEWRAVVRIAPDDAAARAQLARLLTAQADAYLRQDDVTRGEPYAREAVQLAPDDPNARNLLGVALASSGHFDEAIAQFLEALRIAPDNPQARINLERARRVPRGAQ